MNLKVVCTVLCATVGASHIANATPRKLPFSYPYETLPEGELELELYTDVNPLRVPANSADPVAGEMWSPAVRLQNEIEYGLTDRVELGFYQVFQSSPKAGGGSAFQFDGLIWRVRTRLAESGEWPVDVGLYFELETMHDELALEGKVILQRRIDRLCWMANLWVEEEFERPFDGKAQGRSAHFIINPTTGIAWEATQTFHPGIEYFARGQIDPSGDTPEARERSRVHHFAGPTLHFNWGRLSWSAGLYAHLNDTGVPHVGAAYGPFWFRNLIALAL